MAAKERPKGICPECGRTISGRALGEHWVLLRSHNRTRGTKQLTVCLSPGRYRMVARIRDADVGLRAARGARRPMRRPAPMTAHGWTIDEACQEFAAAGLTVDPRRFRVIVRNLPGLQRCGEAPKGPKGGRGDALYPIGDLQELITRLEPWLTPPR